MRYSSLKLIVFLLLGVSCNRANYQKLTWLPPSDSNVHLEIAKTRVFPDTLNKVLYNTDIKILTKSFSGLLFIKKNAPQQYQLVFTTKMGMSLFDMAWNDTGFVYHTSIEQMETYDIITQIKEDFEMLFEISNLRNGQRISRSKFSIDKKKDFDIKQYSITEGISDYYFKHKNKSHFYKIEKVEGKKIKVSINLLEYDEGLPSKINIKHLGKGLKINMEKLEQ